MKKITLKLLTLAFILSTNSAFAATSTGNFQVSSTLNSACTITATNISFGDLKFIGATTEIAATSGKIDVLCSKGVSYNIVPDGPYAQKDKQVMTNGVGVNKDGILIFLSKEGGQAWSNTVGDKILGVGTSAITSHTIGAVTLNLNVKSVDPSVSNQFNVEARPGIYSANVTAIITY